MNKVRKVAEFLSFHLKGTSRRLLCTYVYVTSAVALKLTWHELSYVRKVNLYSLAYLILGANALLGIPAAYYGNRKALLLVSLKLLIT